MKKTVECFSSKRVPTTKPALIWLYCIKIIDYSLKGQYDEKQHGEKHKITVLLGDLTGESWRNQGLKDENRHKVILLWAVPKIREKLEKGNGLKEEEEFEIKYEELPKDWKKAKEPDQVEFEVLIPEQRNEVKEIFPTSKFNFIKNWTMSHPMIAFIVGLTILLVGTIILRVLFPSE